MRLISYVIQSGQDDIRITSSTVNPGDGQLPDSELIFFIVGSAVQLIDV